MSFLLHPEEQFPMNVIAGTIRHSAGFSITTWSTNFPLTPSLIREESHLLQNIKIKITTFHMFN